MINKFSHADMWVAENRVEEYKAAGHKLAAFPAEIPTAEAEQIDDPEKVPAGDAQDEEPVEEKKTTKKSTKKK